MLQQAARSLFWKACPSWPSCGLGSWALCCSIVLQGIPMGISAGCTAQKSSLKQCNGAVKCTGPGKVLLDSLHAAVMRRCQQLQNARL